MKTRVLNIAFFLFTFSSLLFEIQAQEVLQIVNDKSNVVIEGTSNIHDWEMNVEDISSEIQLKEGSESKIESITFNVPVEGLKSGKSRMDKNTYEALKSEEHNTIKFESTSIKDTNAKLYAVGNLTIAGTVKTIEIPLELNKTEDNLNLITSYEINMLDYNVEPPTAMFGTIKTGESIVVKFNLIY